MQEVGTAAAVNPSARVRGGGPRTLIIGESIAHRERIQTTSAGSVQLAFFDMSSMTVGPNGNFTIDEWSFTRPLLVGIEIFFGLPANNCHFLPLD